MTTRKPSRKLLKRPLRERALMALEVAVAKAFAQHARLGRPVYIWREGKVVKLTPREVGRLSKRK